MIPRIYKGLSHLPSLNRDSRNGFRCVQYIDRNKIPEEVFQPLQHEEYRDYYTETPASDEVFKLYKNQFLYDQVELEPKKKIIDEPSEDYIIERITFKAAYGDDQIIALLYLPKNSVPPYQTVIYFPHVGAAREGSILNNTQFRHQLKFIVKNGRALMYPVYIGTWDRYKAANLDMGSKHQSIRYKEYQIKLIKDLKRSIDYLGTRKDIDSSKIAYYGGSWGAAMGLTILAVEDRIAAGILTLGGLRAMRRVRPEIDPINYISRITIPLLMLNGKYDNNFPYEISVKPMYDLLGTQETDKVIRLYETDHFFPINEFIKESLNFLDKYLGPVERKTPVQESPLMP